MNFDEIKLETADAIVEIADLAAGYIEDGDEPRAAATYDYLYQLIYALSKSISADFANELKKEYMSGKATQEARREFGLEDSELSVDEVLQGKGTNDTPGQYL